MSDEQVTGNGTQENALVVSSELFAPAKYVSEDAFEEMASSGGYLPRLQLFGSNSDPVKEGNIPINHYGIVRGPGSLEDLGDSVFAIPLAYRFAAIRMNEGNVVSVYNPNHPEFKKIQEDSQETDSRCMFGTQFLLWLPAKKAMVTFLFGSKSSRKEARNVIPFMPKVGDNGQMTYQGCVFKSKLAKNNLYKWQVPIVLPNSTPVDAPPASRYFVDQLEKFRNPPETSQEFEADEPKEGETSAGAELGRVR